MTGTDRAGGANGPAGRGGTGGTGSTGGASVPGKPGKPGPTPVPASEPFWAAARRGELLLQRCRGCGRHQHYPRVLCAHCWSEDLEWVRAGGRARVWTYTVVHRPGHPAWAEDVPYLLAIVELAEGPRLLTNLVRVDPAEAYVGMAVRAEFAPRGDTALVRFAPDV